MVRMTKREQTMLRALKLAIVGLGERPCNSTQSDSYLAHRACEAAIREVDPEWMDRAWEDWAAEMRAAS